MGLKQTHTPSPLHTHGSRWHTMCEYLRNAKNYVSLHLLKIEFPCPLLVPAAATAACSAPAMATSSCPPGQKIGEVTEFTLGAFASA